MTALLLYLLLVSVCFTAAAVGTEQLFGQRGWPRRFVWLATLIASLAFPLVMALTTQDPVSATGQVIGMPQPPWPDSSLHSHLQLETVIRDANLAAPVSVVHPEWPRTGHLRPSADAILATVWLTSSVATFLLLLVMWIRLSMRFRRCPLNNVQGVVVTMTRTSGPAVFGFLRPRILLPKWLLERPPADQAVAIAHEQEHIAARDPLALLLGLCLVTLAPWNPALWWQLRRLRFAIETDCDMRVLRRGIDASSYAEVLLGVSQHRTLASVGLMALTAHTGSLEQRIRAFTLGNGPLGALRSVIGLLLALGVVALAACVQAPGLASRELRKRPPEDIRPAAVSATAIAREHFPELFTKHFDGTAVVAVIMDREGSLKTAEKHVFAPGTVPADFDLAEENSRLNVDAEEDVMYRGGEYPPWTIGPWLDSRNPGRIFVVYEVLKWSPDPGRTRAQVQAAVAAYDPSLLNTPATLAPDAIQVTAFMNDDGTINRESKREIPPGTAIADDSLERFAALGVKKEQLGRRGFVCGLGSPRTPFQICIDYAWPRRPDETSDIADLNTVWRDISARYPERRDTHDDAAIFGRYLPDIGRRGSAAVKITVGGKQQILMPWVLFGRDGRVWDSGLWPTNSDRYRAGAALSKELEIRYPGTRVYITGDQCRFNRVPVACAWIDAQSPVQQFRDVALQRREDILLTGVFLEPVFSADLRAANPHLPRIIPLDFASGLKFGVQQTVLLGEGSRPLFKARVTVVDARQAQIQVSLPTYGVNLSKDPTDWSQTQVVRVRYGESKILSVSECCANVPAHNVDLVLRLQHLGSN